ncbi:MAG: thiamine biosynthesis protein ThiS [Gammaproteobacteria bacterium MedPE]|nr:MAG: thiamine biosynthesis protein ThiS [Gammaproteobacteria bacterium MedPE]
MINQTIQVIVNQDQQLSIDTDNNCLKTVISLIDIDTATLAVAVNNAIVPRGQWSEFIINDGDRINVFGAIAGG